MLCALPLPPLSPSSASIPPREKSRVKLCGVRSAVGRITEVKLFPSWRLARGNTTPARARPTARAVETRRHIRLCGRSAHGERERERSHRMNILAATVRGGCFFSRINLNRSKLPICRTTVAASCGAQNDDFSRSKRALGLLSLAHTTPPSLPKRLSINS